MGIKINILLLICLLGSFLTPGRAHACNIYKERTRNEKSCCRPSSGQQHSKKDCPKDCCNKSSGGDECPGNCGNQSCQSPSYTFGTLTPAFKCIQKVPGLDAGTPYALYRQPLYSSGFNTIWIPPKIGLS